MQLDTYGTHALSPSPPVTQSSETPNIESNNDMKLEKPIWYIGCVVLVFVYFNYANNQSTIQRSLFLFLPTYYEDEHGLLEAKLREQHV